MRRALLVLCLLCAACGPSVGFGVAVTLHVDATVDDTMLGSIMDLVVSTVGDEDESFPDPLTGPMLRVERFVYRPKPTTRALEISVSALDASGNVVAAGSSPSLAVTPGNTTMTDIILTMNGAGVDLAGVDLSIPITDQAIPQDLGDAAVAPGTDPCRPFTMSSTDAIFASKKLVLAQYQELFPLSIDDKPATSDYYQVNYLSPTGESSKWIHTGGYVRMRPLPANPLPIATASVGNFEREIKLAIATGIVGFVVRTQTVNDVQSGQPLSNLLTAAAAVDPRFKILVDPDILYLSTAAEVEQVVTAVAASPSALRLADGRLVLTAASVTTQPVSFWTGVLSDLSAAGIEVAFVPGFAGWQSFESTYASIIYGVTDYVGGSPAAEMTEETQPALAHADQLVFSVPVHSQVYDPSKLFYTEADNSLTFRTSWSSAIQGDADWVILSSWNDLSDSSAMEPYTDTTLRTDIGNGFYDLTAYYGEWFRTGAQPAITHDVLYWFYRREPTTAPAPAQDMTVLSVDGGPPQDEVERVAFLTAPGTLSITIAGKTQTMDASAGITTFTIPTMAGTPTFALLRNGSPVFSFNGGITIVGSLQSGTSDFVYWGGSGSVAGTCALTAPN